MNSDIITQIAGLIGSLGFPIVVAGYLIWKLGKVADALVTKLDNIEAAIRDLQQQL